MKIMKGNDKFPHYEWNLFIYLKLESLKKTSYITLFKGRS